MTRLSWISWRLWSLRAEPSSFERKGELQMWSEVFCLTCFDHKMPLMAVVHFFGEKIALLVMRMLRSSLSSSRSIHSRASSHSLIVVIDVGFLTLLMVRSFPAGACWVGRFHVSPSTWKTADAFSGKCERPGGSGIGGLADMELEVWLTWSWVCG